MIDGENNPQGPNFDRGMPEMLVHMYERIGVIDKRAKVLGVDVSMATDVGGRVSVIGGDLPMFGASIGKLPLAELAIHSLPAEQTWQIKPSNKLAGGGLYDNILEPVEASTADLISDMLGPGSGNTAFSVLAEELGGPDAINDSYTSRWRNTHVDIAQNGRALLGVTTPSEALQQVKAILHEDTGDPILREAAVNALRDIKEHGFTPLRGYVEVFRKTGEYNGDTDDPFVYRHDVGYVEDWRWGKGHKPGVAFAIFTRSSKTARGVIANMVVSQLGAEVARAAGGSDVASLGSRALRFVL